MRVIVLVLAVSAVALARPQFSLSNKGYEGLQIALDGRTPVAISSGRLLYSAVDTGNNLVVVNVDGTGPAAGGGGLPTELIRTNDQNLGAGINAVGQGVIDFGRGVLDFTGDVVGGIGDVAEGTLQGFADLTGIANIRSPDDSSFRSLTEGVAAAPAVIIVDEAAPGSAAELGQGLNDFGQGTLQFGLGVRDAVSDGVGVVGQVAEDILQGFADLTGIADIGAPTNTLAAEEAPAFRSAIEVAPVVVAPVEIAPGLAAAVARSGLVAVEDIAVVAPLEAIVAPAPAEAVGVSLSTVVRRKRQIIEGPVSNARAIGNGLGSLGGLFGSTVGRFFDSVAFATVEMVDGLESLGTIAIDQVENRFDDNPDNDFFRR